jgi:hypothetical protein
LSLPIFANLLIILVLIMKVSPELANCILGMLTIAARDGCTIGS